MYKLVIGNKNYSSWSLRPWLLMKIANIEFEEININIYSVEGKEALKAYTDTGKVPILIDNNLTIWDSLSIAEYLAEHHPAKTLWPLSQESRSAARSIVSEMHSGFNGIRNELPMNCRRHSDPPTLSSEAEKDVQRLCHIWQYCRENYGEQGSFLFGQFSIADAFFAPVVIRLKGYNIPVTDSAQHYIDTMYALPELQQWIKTASAETVIVEKYERI